MLRIFMVHIIDSESWDLIQSILLYWYWTTRCVTKNNKQHVNFTRCIATHVKQLFHRKQVFKRNRCIINTWWIKRWKHFANFFEINVCKYFSKKKFLRLWHTFQFTTVETHHCRNSPCKVLQISIKNKLFNSFDSYLKLTTHVILELTTQSSSSSNFFNTTLKNMINESRF